MADKDIGFDKGGVGNINETAKSLQQGTHSAEPPSATQSAESARRNFVVTPDEMTQYRERVKSGLFAMQGLLRKMGNGSPP